MAEEPAATLAEVAPAALSAAAPVAAVAPVAALAPLAAVGAGQAEAQAATANAKPAETPTKARGYNATIGPLVVIGFIVLVIILVLLAKNGLL